MRAKSFDKISEEFTHPFMHVLFAAAESLDASNDVPLHGDCILEVSLDFAKEMLREDPSLRKQLEDFGWIEFLDHPVFINRKLRGLSFFYNNSRFLTEIE